MYFTNQTQGLEIACTGPEQMPVLPLSGQEGHEEGCTPYVGNGAVTQEPAYCVR